MGRTPSKTLRIKILFIISELKQSVFESLTTRKTHKNYVEVPSPPSNKKASDSF